MEEVIKMLHSGDYSCVIKKGRNIRTFTKRGVADLFDLIENEPEFLEGSTVADKVVGKGAAALMAYGGVRKLYADVISEAAIALLAQNEVCCEYELRTPYIENRDKTGVCPVEKICAVSNSPQELFELIGAFLEKVRGRQMTLT